MVLSPLLLAAFGLAVPITALARPDLNAFLNKKATTVKALVEQVRSDAEVLDRYQRHFAMSKSEVMAYLSSLQPGRMDNERVYTIYSVPPGGQIKMRYAKVRAGTPVFTDFAGVPVLIAKCGNPLHRGPKDPVAKNDDPDRVQRSKDELREISSDVDLPVSEDFVALVPETPVVPEELVTTNQSPVVILPAAFGFNPLLLGIGLPFIIIGGGDDSIDPPPIPEPATLTVMSFGAAWAALRRRRRT